MRQTCWAISPVPTMTTFSRVAFSTAKRTETQRQSATATGTATAPAPTKVENGRLSSKNSQIMPMANAPAIRERTVNRTSSAMRLAWSPGVPHWVSSNSAVKAAPETSTGMRKSV